MVYLSDLNEDQKAQMVFDLKNHIKSKGKFMEIALKILKSIDEGMDFKIGEYYNWNKWVALE